nr:hypothetical protein [Tanacetum cinerariifolium]
YDIVETVGAGNLLRFEDLIQKALDDELVAPANRIKIEKINIRLSSNLKSKESRLQVVLDALKLTPFYNAFEISIDVPEIYMQEFWVTVSRHHSSLHFKLNCKIHTVNVDNFKDMLKIFPKLPGQIFEEPPPEEEILSFIRDLGHTDLVFQMENKNSKKNNDMYYPRFTKFIVDYFMAKDQLILNHLPKRSLLKLPKEKRIKTSAKGDKPVKMKQSAIKSKGLTVLSKATLSEADQIKLVTKRSKKEFHSSYTSGSGDGVDIQSKVLDEQQQTVSGTNEGAGDKPEHDSEDDNDEHDNANDNDDEDDYQENVIGETESDDNRDDFVHPNLSTYNANDQEEENEEEKANDDDEVSSNQKVSTPPDYEISNEEDNQEDDDTVMGGEQEDEEDEELYEDLNLNLDRRDAKMTDAQINKQTKEVHVTLTTELLVVQQQSSFVSSDLVSKFINPTSDDSILNPNAQFDIPVKVSVSVTTKTPSSDTTDPQPPIPIIQPQQQTHDSTTTIPIPTTSLPEIPHFASLFGFERRVSSLESELSELNKPINLLKIEEAQAKNEEFLKEIDSNIKAIIKDHVKAQTSYVAAASLSEFESNKILIDKLEENKSMHKSDVQKNLYNPLIESYNSDEDIFASYGDVVTLKRGHDDQDKDEEPFAGSNRGTKRRRSDKKESLK